MGEQSNLGEDKLTKNNMKKRMTRTKKIIIIILAIILLVVAGGMGYSYYKLSKIKTVTISKNKADLGIKPENESKIASINDGNKMKNILLLGIDDQEKASDTNIVLSIDSKNNKLKMTSIMRDSFIDFQSADMQTQR